MLKMDQVHVIRHKVERDGKSQRDVAKELGISRNTVKKYLNESDPKWKERKRRSSPVTDRVAPRIDELLEEWKEKTTKKQRITMTRIYRKLREEGYEVGFNNGSYLHGGKETGKSGSVYSVDSSSWGRRTSRLFRSDGGRERSEKESLEIRHPFDVCRVGFRLAV